MKCMPYGKCVSCFGALQSQGIDWASVAPNTPCHDVVDFLFKGNYCTELEGDNAAIDIFCNTFDICVAWYDNQNGGGDGGGGGNANDTNDTVIDCSTLTVCNWKGFHRGFLGDGICHENYPGCYNTAVCDFDGGDCCEDTCSDKTSYAECGHDGYYCRDTQSKRCDPSLTAKCVTPDADKSKFKPEPDPNSVTCKAGESKYRLVMFDSFGDGWDSTFLSLTLDGDKSKLLFKGQLKDGAQGTEFICLSSAPTCYHVDVSGGVWGNEVSWEVRPFGEGTKAIADGGAPMDCTFSVAGASCPRTCSGKPNVDPNLDPDYKTYKEMFNCIREKCVIQVGSCMADPACAPCFSQEAPEYCFANDNFNTVIDCGLCQCTDNYDGFCETKRAGPGAVIPKTLPDDQPFQQQCTAAETLQGSSAVLTFSNCTKFDQVAMMVTDFDENNFGALDTFEACAHSFQNDAGHGGKTAMFCMKILADAMIKPESEHKDGVPTEAIATLATLLYHNAENFCECAGAASAACPLCPSFLRFKTLLYESLDACKALDEIDCAAWNEFYPNCKANLEATFQKVDFGTPAQCKLFFSEWNSSCRVPIRTNHHFPALSGDYVKSSCGGAGPFPAFRKLDCGKELSKTVWDFYVLYDRSCLQGSNGIPPSPAIPVTPTGPVPTTVVTPAPVYTPSTLKPYNPSDGDGGAPKPYIPSDDDSTPKSKPYPAGGGNGEKTGSSHFWRNIFIIGILGCGVYFYYKRSNDSFAFVRYRSAPRNFGSESELMMGGGGGPTLSLSHSGNFEPPSLPPPPSAMGHSGYP
jgi:hypothetical protein